MKIEFKNPLEIDTSSYVSVCGLPYEDDYQLSLDDNGCEYLKKVGVIETYKLIQSHRDSCDLAYILDTLDPDSVLGSGSPNVSFDDIYIDFTKFPTNPGEAFNLIKNAEFAFNKLPFELRQECNFSPNVFVKNLDKLAEKFSKVDKVESVGVSNE
ncbi:minor capsid protein [Capybara microvirus Cap3_SP_465]|nr:minor capsid protein [Capybara microvirus Cap3_SP_465]